ncbi:DUF349 domain-containing protein [Flavobacteriaceae bacterium S356]|uniref:DUF349 domain-containing protein n=1 Tax=Asprobacillus argus TaxID=3076534 RepID=A0ABU3LGW7_9FLAO|nr:DUF349 domain-containing protein [Flavobacteriaceae bacterium S356]
MLEPNEEKEILDSSVLKDKNENQEKPPSEKEEEVNAVDESEEIPTEKKEPSNEEISTEEAVVEVEKEVAKDSEKDERKEQIPEIDYEVLDLGALNSELEKLINNYPIQQIRTQAEAIKNAFNKKFGTLLAEKKEAFLAEGGNAIDFQFSSPVKQKYNGLLSDYRKKRDRYYGDLEKQLKENLAKRLQVIEDLKALIQEADTKTMYKQFRELQNTWRGIGGVPKTKYNDTWRTYQHHVERFYDLLHLSNDFRDIDFKNNLEQKLILIQKAQELADSDDSGYAFRELQKLHKQWKEEVGPVAKEMREEVWKKFSAATKTIHDKRHDHYRVLKSKHKDVIEKKLKVIETIDQYDVSKNKTHKDWQQSIREIEALRKQYFEAGKLPYSKSENIWLQFKAATKKFNQVKNEFYKGEKSNQQENLQKKLALIETAESLKDSKDWEATTETFKKIQSDWKKIGHVPRKFSDDLWKKFKGACNYYFDRFHEQKNALNPEQQAIVDAKKSFMENLKDSDKHTKESVKELMNAWNALGRLPRSARHLDSKFSKIIDKALGTLAIDKSELVMLKFRNIVDGYLANNNFKKLDSELIFVRKKIDESVREIQQLENNLSFFSNAKDDNPLVQNVRTRVEGFKNDLVVWKQKLAYLKKLEY